MLSSHLTNALEVAGLALQIYLLARYTFRGPLLKYPLLVLYLVTASLTGIAEYFVQNFGSYERFIHLYYTDEVGVDLLLFLMVIWLTYRAMDENPMRKAAGRALAGITVTVLVLPFLVFHESLGTFSRFYNGVSEVLNLGAAIMNLVLWTALLGARKRDIQQILVCAGLGLLVTAQAIGFGVRHLLPNRELRWIPDLFMAGAYLVSMYIWWRAMRVTPAQPRERSAPMGAELPATPAR